MDGMSVGVSKVCPTSFPWPREGGAIPPTRELGNGCLVEYAVNVIDDSEMPGGLPWAIVRTCGGVHLFIIRSRSTFETGLADVLGAAWEASAKYGAGRPRPLLQAV